jgi:AI-2 transport protein TqsA
VQAEQRIQTICLLLLTALAIATALHWLRAVLIPFVVAVFATFAINPLVVLLIRRARFRRGIAILTTLLIGLVLFLLAAAIVSSSVAQLTQNAGAYQEKMTVLAQQIGASIPVEDLTTELEKRLTQLPIGSMLIGLANSLVGILSNAILVLIFVIFLLIGGPQADPEEEGVWSEIQVRVERYLIAQLTLSAATGLLVGLVLYVLGLELALMFGFLAFLLNFIPSLGSIVATLLPLPVVLVSPESSWTTAVLVVALPGSIQFIIGSVIAPKVMGEYLQLHPIAILLALIFWGLLWGIMGMFLAVPITAVLKILLDRSELTQPVGRLLEGRLS